MDTCETIKVKPWGKGQGDFVEINVEDYDASTHVLFEAGGAPLPTRADLDGALNDLPGAHEDADYVVGAMRQFFGDLFTEDDEAAVRLVVPAKAKLASEGLTVEQLKVALADRQIAIPDGVTLKADLAALLDATVAGK